jgi:NADH dehydrogenase
MIEHNTHRKVVVIGGGSAGTVAANRLRRRTDVGIALVNPRPEFVDRIRLHQFVSGTGDVAVDYGTLLGEGIELVVDSATHIDTADRMVRLASGHALDYDYVIYAVGSTTAVPSVPGAAEFAFSVAELESAQRLRARLEADRPASRRPPSWPNKDARSRWYAVDPCCRR